MTIQEYSTLMGYEKNCETAEYETANFVYMAAGDMPKEEFCREYKKHGSSQLVTELAEAVRNARKAYVEKKNECVDKEVKDRSAAHSLLREANEIRESGMYASADAIEDIAATLIGRKDCILWKLHKGFCLSAKDNEYIAGNLG